MQGWLAESRICIFISDMYSDICICIYIYIYKRNTIIISSIQLPKSWQAMLGFGDDPQKREVGTVDLLILEPMVEMTGETT